MKVAGIMTKGTVTLIPGEDDEDGITMRLKATAAEGTGQASVVHLERWEKADSPMKVFVENHRDETLDEMLRAEGRGSPHHYQQCGECKSAEPLFRCARQTCIGPAMYCEHCIVKLHRQLPTHMLEKPEFSWAMNLGHIAHALVPAHKDFVIIDTLGIRVVKLNFCGCDTKIEHRQQLMRACLWPATSIDPQTCSTFNAIRLFEVQNCLGKISAYDFVRSLELLSNNDGLSPPPDRRRAFRAIVRQYRMMEMLKRAGRGHDDSGVCGTHQGELALPCRACPQPGINLPEGWDEIDWDTMDEDQRYKYFLYLSQDANFKLINRNVSTEARDPIVDDGAGYFCNRGEYAEHIAKNVDDEEISSCSGFQAMFLANAKRVKGLRVTGVGGVTCARHNMWRPNGIGDLQMGERQCNMDFLMFASLLGFMLTYLILSYDIACQFSKKIWSRMEKLPIKYHLNIVKDNVRWMVPNFHLPGHKKGCHSPFSFHWLWGAGCTHGETVEQNWEFLNGIAASTKLMGLGARHAALEGLFGFHNWRRLVSHRRLLKQRLAEAIKDGRAHKEAFKAFNDGLVGQGVEVESWKAWVDKWEKSQHVENEKGSPYEYEEEGLSLKQIRVLLAAEEYLKTGDGTEVEREDTPSTFITMGMEIEETHRRNQSRWAKSYANPGAGLSATPHDSARGRLQAFRKLQGTYMPKLRHYLAPAQKVIYDADSQPPEATRLFMPSDIASSPSRIKACAPGLDGIEARLRKGEAGEALGDIRRGLRTRTMTNRFKIRNWMGQRALTRGQGILRQINIRIHAATLRYRYARHAMLKLMGHGEWEKEFQVLEDSDVRALNDRSLREEEQAQDEHLGALGVAAGLPAMGAVATGEGHRTLSWIWYSVSTTAEGDAKLHEALRVEWCKAYSRANRWREEAVLVEEEMRRTVEFGRFAERRWRERAGARTHPLGKLGRPVDGAVMEGVRAYALEQADRERRTNEKLEKEWGPIRVRAVAYLKGKDASGLEKIVVEVDEEEARWAEAKMYADEEGENDMYQ
ncbi:CxC2 domain-containing protein [Mycena venus]|uniref:CxC2 domain-containing protein n=1 Tax=Mycena venus TaxID=2733690 RepID=A0A8H6Y5B9_9AGAR|nr:CxC2 domain-containing protein [Mycena venus]